MIKLANINKSKVVEEIIEFILNKTENKNGAIVGLSGGVDSTLTVALLADAFKHTSRKVLGINMPSYETHPAKCYQASKIAEELDIDYRHISIHSLVDAYTHPFFEFSEISDFDKGNMVSRIRANILHTVAAQENCLVAGTGNRDEDYGIGYFTLFGDGAAHFNPIGELPKRLVRELAEWYGFVSIARNEPTAELEPGQTDFKDLGYSYNTVELIIEALTQRKLVKVDLEEQVIKQAALDIDKYKKWYGKSKFHTVSEIVQDILDRHCIMYKKMQIVNPDTAPVTLEYKNNEKTG